MADPDESPERWVTCELVYAELWRRRASVRLPRGSRVTRTEWSGRWIIFHVLTDPAPAPPVSLSPPATSSWENPPVPTPTRRERRKESRIQRRKRWRYRDLDDPGGQQTPERAVIPDNEDVDDRDLHAAPDPTVRLAEWPTIPNRDGDPVATPDLGE